jgi:PIN domain nuclease of toxin-antitoxin system
MIAGSPGAVLLDTCAVIWMASGTLAPAAVATLVAAGQAGGLYVSSASAWEIGLLSRPKRGRALQFLPDAKTWFRRFMTGPSIRDAPLTAAIAIDASFLPGRLHGDPADRLIIATARHLGFPLVTRDRKVIAYAAAGFLDVIPC